MALETCDPLPILSDKITGGIDQLARWYFITIHTENRIGRRRVGKIFIPILNEWFVIFEENYLATKTTQSLLCFGSALFI